jgi:uncharacterized protein (TIGR03382 family)
MVILDKSSSMQTGTIGGVTKWQLARQGLDEVLAIYDTKAEFGLMTFPQPDQCSPGAVEVAPALNSRGDILAALAAPPPTAGNWTPLAQTLEAAAVEPLLVNAAGERHAIVISDGWQWCSPYDPATRFDGVDAVTALNTAGVTTWVVGFGDAVDAAALNLMAVEAGTAKPGCDPTNTLPTDPDHCYYQADSVAELIDALEAIAGVIAVETCDGQDNDCDGLVDEALAQECTTACGAGTETCQGGVWVGCDAPAPASEVCDGADNDCDGTTDPGCACTAGTERPCGETLTTGVCQPGTQTCGANGQWGGCEGSVGPGTEMCDGLDNDCDGSIDDADGEVGNLCDLGEVCVDGGCQPVDPETPPDDEEGNGADYEAHAGCGCASGGDAPALVPLVLFVGAVLGRRRRAR